MSSLRLACTCLPTSYIAPGGTCLQNVTRRQPLACCVAYSCPLALQMFPLNLYWLWGHQGLNSDLASSTVPCRCCAQICSGWLLTFGDLLAHCNSCWMVMSPCCAKQAR